MRPGTPTDPKVIETDFSGIRSALSCGSLTSADDTNYYECSPATQICVDIGSSTISWSGGHISFFEVGIRVRIFGSDGTLSGGSAMQLIDSDGFLELEDITLSDGAASVSISHMAGQFFPNCCFQYTVWGSRQYLRGALCAEGHVR